MSAAKSTRTKSAPATPLEEWLVVPGHPRYEASSTGRVRLIDSGRIVAQRGHGSGSYLGVHLDGKRIRVHSVIASAWLGEQQKGFDVNHIDGNKQNNCADNLEYVTRQENMQHAQRTGLWNNRGENHPLAKTTKEQILEAIAMIEAGSTMASAAAHVGVDPEVIGKVRRGKRWKHLGLGVFPKLKCGCNANTKRKANGQIERTKP